MKRLPNQKTRTNDCIKAQTNNTNKRLKPILTHCEKLPWETVKGLHTFHPLDMSTHDIKTFHPLDMSTHDIKTFHPLDISPPRHFTQYVEHFQPVLLRLVTHVSKMFHCFNSGTYVFHLRFPSNRFTTTSF